MVWVLVIALLVVPWLEFWLVMRLHWPLWFTLLWFCGAAAVGWWFARGEDLTLWTELEAEVQNRRVPTPEGIDAMLVLIGAWALIVPGLLSDAVGILLLVPPVRAALVGPIRAAIRRHWIDAA